MRRHLAIAVMVLGVFVFFMAQAQANDSAALTTILSNRCVNLMETISRIPAYVRLFLDMPVLNFRLEKIGWVDIENIKQIERSV